MPPKTILVVDDEEVIVDLCWHVLSNEGFQVIKAYSGEEALDLCQQEPFHLVLLDMLMPGIDGLEAFEALREKRQDLIGVLITGHGNMETAIQAMQLGFSGFIRKPFSNLELVQVVKDSFGKAELAEENTRLRTLIPLYRLGEKFVKADSREEVLEELIKTVSRQTGARRISAMLYDKEEECLRIRASMGIKSETLEQTQVKPGEKIAGWVFKQGEALILNGGPDKNPRFAAHLKNNEIIAAISYPLKARDQTLGVLNISKIRRGQPFSPADLEMLSVICGQAVMAIENIRIMEERAEKVRMRTLLEQYVAPEVAEVLISHGPQLLDLGEIRAITILFADIRNFTPLVQHLPLETLREFLNEFFDLLTAVVFRFKGTLDKFIGDAVLAFFGAPMTHEKPSKAAVDAAMSMIGRFEELKEKWTEQEPSFAEIGLGIGISAGETYLGNLGSQKRFDYTVIGRDVNVSQRLSAASSSGQILLTESVRVHLGPGYPVVQEAPLELKGLEEPLPIFSISNLNGD